MKNTALSCPDWLSRAAVYQLNLRTFSPEGTLKAATRELPFLASLGFTVMYLCSIFQEDASDDPQFISDRQKRSQTNNPKNPYRITDYFSIDPEYGTLEDLKEFVDTAHSLGQRVVLDLVFDHMGPNADILKRHPDFAYQDSQGNTMCTIWHFPMLDFANPGLREYAWCNMVYYVAVLDVDGFRCDVGDAVPLDFWTEGRRRIQAVKPEAVLINEGHNYASLRLAFDSMYCFSWHEILYEVYIQGKPVSAVRQNWEQTAAQLLEGSLLLRDMDNHDTVSDWCVRNDWDDRVEKKLGHEGMEQLLVLNYLMDGIPMIYCGNELGDDEKRSFFANRFYPGRFAPTDRRIAKEAYSLRRQDVMKRLNALKKESDVLRFGKTVWTDGVPECVIAFRREWAGRAIHFMGNASGKACKATWTGKPATVLFETGCTLEAGQFTLAPYGYIVWEE